MNEEEDSDSHKDSEREREDLQLIEGDRYKNENGYWVFTSQYLTRRGTCCENSCQHCPYGFKK